MRDLLWMEIDLKQIVNNIKDIEKNAKKKVIPVVKSEAYNLGEYVINYLVNNLNLDYLAVVDFKEATRLSNLNQEILILNSLEKEEYAFLNQYPNLVISINRMLDVENLNLTKLNRTVKVHIQVDTGMNRFGFKELSEVNVAINKLKTNPNVQLEGLYTHFTSKKNAKKQLNRFIKYTSLYNFKMIHLAASSTYKFIDYGNYVRVGLDVYGINSKMQSLKISCFPIEIRKIAKGETVGYDETYKAKKNLKIALLPIGYANGFRRSLKGYKIMAKNKLYKTIGNICMNHVFVEIDDDVDLNTEFIITSKEHPIEKMAKFLKTTPHEILCMFNIKERKYLKD